MSKINCETIAIEATTEIQETPYVYTRSTFIPYLGAAIGMAVATGTLLTIGVANAVLHALGISWLTLAITATLGGFLGYSAGKVISESPRTQA